MAQRAHHEEEKKALSPTFVSICFAVMMAGCLGISWMHFQSYTPKELPVDVRPVSPEIIKNFGGHPGIAHVGLIIESFQKFQITENNFLFNGTLWFRFDPNFLSLETINNVSIKNGQLLHKSPPKTRLVGGLLFVRYAIQAEVQCNLDFKDFPDDDHTIYIIFTHSGMSPNGLVFESTRPDLVVLDDMDRQGWAQFDLSVAAGYFSSHVQSSVIDVEFANPVVVFGIEYRHNSMNSLLNILLPLLVMLGLILFSFSIDREKFWKQRLEASVQAIAASIAFRFVIETMSPKVGYTMASDKFFFMFLFFYLITFIITLNADKLNVMREKIIVITITISVIIGTALIWATG